MFDWLRNLLNQTTQRQSVLESGYPRVMLHEGVDGRGRPLINALGGLDWVVAGSIARYGLWCVSPTDLYDSRQDAVRAVRSMHPGMKVWAHVLGPRYWQVSAPVGWSGRLEAGIGPDFCRKADGTPWPSGSGVYARIDLARVQGVLVDAWAELLTSGMYDGILVDWMAYSDTWMLDGKLDLTPWGGSIEAWDAAMRAGKGAVLDELRRRFPAATIIGNGGPRGWYSGGEQASGWCRENFPNQGGGTWASNITGPDGLIADADYYHAPQASVLFTACNPLDGRAALFGLASSCLGNGVFVVGPSNFDPTVSYRSWWLAEYAKPTLGWLGQPKGLAYQIATDTSTRWHRDFDHGSVWVDPATSTGGFSAS